MKKTGQVLPKSSPGRPVPISPTGGWAYREIDSSVLTFDAAAPLVRFGWEGLINQ
jgi:hypothetical protein